MKNFVAELESMSSKAVSDIGKISEKVAQEIQVLLTKAFADVKAHISSLLDSFSAKIKSLGQRRISTSAGPSTTSFTQRVRSAVKSAESEAERLFHNAKTEAAAMIHEARSMIQRMADGLGSARGDVTADIRKAGQDIYHTLISVGESAVKKVGVFFESAFKDIELDGSFVASHALQVSEAAAISVVNPALVTGLALSAAIIIAAHSYAESIRKKS